MCGQMDCCRVADCVTHSFRLIFYILLNIQLCDTENKIQIKFPVMKNDLTGGIKRREKQEVMEQRKGVVDWKRQEVFLTS